MKASIVIRTYNEERYLKALLEGIEEQSFDPDFCETIIVDSGSTDSTLEIASAFKTKIVGIKKEEFSFGRSLNIGIEASTGDALVLISGHCVPASKEWLSQLIQPLIEDNNVGVTYGKQLPGPETFFSEAQIFAKYFPASESPSQSEFYCNNANAAVRRETWERYKYDEELTGLEDMHLAKKATSDGFKVRYTPNAPVFHYHHESWRQIKRRFEREAIALKEIMPELHVTFIDAIRYWFAGVLGDYSIALNERKLLPNLLSIPKYRLCQYYGSW